jgi:trans-aconitate 2-methyltransferase
MHRQPEPELMDLPEEARAYAQAKFPGIMEDVIGRLTELAGDRQSPRMVDLGTGPGTIPIMLAKAQPTWQITAVDAAKSMLTIAQVSVKISRLSDRIKLHLADAKATGLPDHSFDVVFCNSLLHHMPDPQPLWAEIKRLAAPGALIFVRDLRRPASETAAREIVNRIASDQTPVYQEEFYRSLLSAFEVEEVRKQLETARLSHLTVTPYIDRYLDITGTM